MKKQVCSSLLALTMTLGMVTPALAAETENKCSLPRVPAPQRVRRTPATWIVPCAAQREHR